MRTIGYACMTMNVPNTNFKHCNKKKCDPQTLMDATAHNLLSLDHIISYNAKEDIRLFRISSDIVPFGSHETISFPWHTIFADELLRIGEKAKQANIRLSMHPGQYTVLNSPNNDVVRAAVRDLVYHCQFLEALGTATSSKIILHIGGAYNDRANAIQRFKDNYRLLPQEVKNRVIIENDDRIYTIQEVLQIGQELSIPVVFDVLHNEINPSAHQRSDQEWIALCSDTWQEKDGTQKIHYSQQALGKRPGSHSNSIDANVFSSFYDALPDTIDVMLEVKDKNWSAKKCILAVSSSNSIAALEKEWAHYKYAVLEKSARHYQNIRQLLKNKQEYPVLAFYSLIDDSLALPHQMGGDLNACQHIWGYFKNLATDSEKKRFALLIHRYQTGTGKIQAVKRFLWTLSEKYEQSYLKDSYYFFVDNLYD